MAGYWNKPEETAAAIRDGWMHTGDGRFMDDDGYVFIVDRLKDMIITGGENVYSVEVEDVAAGIPRWPLASSSASRTRSGASGSTPSSSSGPAPTRASTSCATTSDGRSPATRRRA